MISSERPPRIAQFNLAEPMRPSPSDPAIRKAEIPALDRTMPFALEQRYLLREQHGGAAWFAIAVFATLLVIALVWVMSFVVAAWQLSRPARQKPVRELAAA